MASLIIFLCLMSGVLLLFLGAFGDRGMTEGAERSKARELERESLKREVAGAMLIALGVGIAFLMAVM